MGITPPTPPEKLAQKLYAVYMQRNPAAGSADWQDAPVSEQQTFIAMAQVAIEELSPAAQS